VKLELDGRYAPLRDWTLSDDPCDSAPGGPSFGAMERGRFGGAGDADPF